MAVALLSKPQWNSILSRSAKTRCRIRKRFSQSSESANGNIASVVFLRHGQSLWNKIPTFSGWCDVPLTEHGIEQAKEAGTLLRERGFNFDIAYTSQLQRAKITCETAIEATESEHAIPVIAAWQLNERHYGILQGRAKDDPVLIGDHGHDQITRWRREFYATPPPMDEGHPYYEPPPAPLTGKLLEHLQQPDKYFKRASQKRHALDFVPFS